MNHDEDTVDLTLVIHHMTEKAILVSDDGDQSKAQWLPKSQVKYELADKSGDVFEVTCPTWLAKKKGFI